MPRTSLRFPVIAEGAEYLVMGYLMRRNILAYKAPPGNEGYDLICIHPDPRHRPAAGELAQVRVQVKSRYRTGARSFPVKAASFDAFDFVIAAFLNIGGFARGQDGGSGARAPEFYTLPPDVIHARHRVSGGWGKVSLSGLAEEQLALYKDGAGFELIAQALGISRPTRPADTTAIEDES
jgi:hypothetical protein